MSENLLRDSTLVPVQNMVDHRVVYALPELNRRVVFEAFQEKRIPAGELRALNYTVGGDVLIHQYLCVKSDDLREEFNIPSDMVEYDWTLDDIKRVLTDPDTPIEALEDALDFGPEGIKEMLVDYAVKMKISDTNRRKIITRMTGIDVNKMIALTEEMEKDQEDMQTTNLTTRRRRLSIDSEKASGRRLQN